MELIQYAIPASTKKLVIAPLGDLQWSGDCGPTAQDHLRRHIDHCLKQDAYFVGMGDMIDTLSPSNRRKLLAAGLYDTAQQVLKEKAWELATEVYDKFLKPTTGRWLGYSEGHHFYEADGETSDEYLCGLLKAKFVGTSAYVRIPRADLTLLMHHGVGGGILPGAGLNKLYHWSAGLTGADIVLIGHNTKLASARLSRPFPIWGKKPKLEHRDIFLINCGGFSKSNVVGHRVGSIIRGDYAEQAMMTPSPLSAPIITVDLTAEANERIRVSV